MLKLYRNIEFYTSTFQRTTPIPDGVYDGSMTGNFIMINIEGIDYKLQTVEAVKGIEVPVKVILKNSIPFEVKVL